MLIAQAQTTSAPASPLLRGFFHRLAEGQLLTQPEFIDYLTNIQVLEASLLVICGLVYMLYGWKVLRVLIIINAAALGVLLGSQLGAHIDPSRGPLWGAVAGGLLLAVLVWPLMKYAIGIMGGLIGGLAGYWLWGYFVSAIGQPEWEPYAWAGSLAGLLLLGILSFFLLRLVVMIFTSLQGSAMVVSGLLGLLMKSEAARSSVHESLVGSMHLIPILIGIPTLIGFGVQLAGSRL
ncbi:MAG: DUF4203 domain-containing protein, partial [Phycisphaerae bacterium]